MRVTVIGTGYVGTVTGASLQNGEANLSYLESAARSVGPGHGRRALAPRVVNKSNVLVGCGNLVETLLRETVVSTASGARLGSTVGHAS